MERLTFTCPVCHDEVPRGAKACPNCGACEMSGWSEDQYLDGLNLPDDPDDALPPRQEPWKYSWVVVVVLLLAFLSLAIFRH